MNTECSHDFFVYIYNLNLNKTYFGSNDSLNFLLIITFTTYYYSILCIFSYLLKMYRRGYILKFLHMFIKSEVKLLFSYIKM